MGRAVGHGLGWLEFFEEMAEPRQKTKVLYPLPELFWPEVTERSESTHKRT
jgi:hypothetical protein